jgi:heme exporter protein CcmD
MPEFLDFGKNSVFIWACYGISFLSLAGLILHALLARKAAKRKLREIKDLSA